MSLTIHELDAIVNRPWAPVEDGCSELQIMQSAAGFYVGRHKIVDGYPMPYCRESGYFETQERANLALEFLRALEEDQDE